MRFTTTGGLAFAAQAHFFGGFNQVSELALTSTLDCQVQVAVCCAKLGMETSAIDASVLGVVYSSAPSSHIEYDRGITATGLLCAHGIDEIITTWHYLQQHLISPEMPYRLNSALTRWT